MNLTAEMCRAARVEAGHGRYRTNPFRERGYTLRRLESELREASEALRRADELAASSTFVLRGNAGTGKTHLLCDVMKRRVEAHQPTVLLMGQRFVSNDAPWPQVLQHLDLAGLSAEEFIGALEASAQASGERALIAIDAINEGTGGTVWPTHLAAFLAQVERLTWTPETEPVLMRASQPARLGQEKPHETQAPHTRTDHPKAAHC